MIITAIVILLMSRYDFKVFCSNILILIIPEGQIKTYEFYQAESDLIESNSNELNEDGIGKHIFGVIFCVSNASFSIRKRSHFKNPALYLKATQNMRGHIWTSRMCSHKNMLTVKLLPDLKD